MIMARAEATTGVDFPAIAAAPSITTLIDAKIRFFTPMIVIYMVGYIGLTALAGFAKGLMALKAVSDCASSREK